MADDTYLRHYARTLDSRAGAGRVGALFRQALDARARRLGQADRYALHLPRIMALTGIADSGPRTVLEIGPGDGWALSYRRPGLTRRAVDQGGDFAAALEARGIDFAVCDVGRERLPAEDGSVDLAVMNNVIEHIGEPRPVLAELRRVLKPGGALYLRTPDVKRVGMAFYDDYTHVRPYTAISLAGLARAAGFAPLFLHWADQPRINLDILTGGRLRAALCSRAAGGKELEAGFRR